MSCTQVDQFLNKRRNINLPKTFSDPGTKGTSSQKLHVAQWWENYLNVNTTYTSANTPMLTDRRILNKPVWCHETHTTKRVTRHRGMTPGIQNQTYLAPSYWPRSSEERVDLSNANRKSTYCTIKLSLHLSFIQRKCLGAFGVYYIKDIIWLVLVTVLILMYTLIG